MLAQHGAAKGKKINTAIDKGSLVGAVFAPREEKYVNIYKYCKDDLILDRKYCFLDPQLYYATFEGKIFKNLEENIYYPTKLTRRDWRKKTPELINFLDSHAEQSRNISDNLVTPGFYIQSLDWKFDYSIDIYEYCYENYNFSRYYLSLLISNNFFHSKSDVDEMIEDIIDNVDHKEGIYFSICYEKSQDNNYEYIDAQNLANILYFVYSLKKEGFDILIGYTFVNSILFAMLGCEYVATGWFNNLRKFRNDRFEETDNMGRRKKRYLSLPLFTYITFENLNNISRNMNIRKLLSKCSIDEYMVEDQDAISFVDLELQYWEALNKFIEEVNSYETLADKIKFVLSQINNAKDLYKVILENLEDHNKEAYNRIKAESKHLDSWIMGIETFKNRVAIIM